MLHFTALTVNKKLKCVGFTVMNLGKVEYT